MTNNSIRDNHQCGNVGDFLKEIVKSNSNVSIVSAYFTIYAYHHLKTELDEIKWKQFEYKLEIWDKKKLDSLGIDTKYKRKI